MSRILERWPLTIVGLILIGWAASTLADHGSTSTMTGVVLGLGVFLLGAGTTLVILGVGRGRGGTARKGDDDDTG
jgi:hypothetical protein